MLVDRLGVSIRAYLVVHFLQGTLHSELTDLHGSQHEGHVISKPWFSSYHQQSERVITRIVVSADTDSVGGTGLECCFSVARQIMWNRYSAGYGIDGSGIGVQFPAGAWNLIICTVSRPVVGLTLPPVQLVQGGSFPRSKAAGA
jgi:hypothetical protein